MADGNIYELVSAVLGPLDRFLDYLFYTGVIYGSRNLARLVIQACKGVRTYFIPIGRAVDEGLSEKYGKWAVITGGTTGIGLAYAHEFARRKMNIILISKSYDDLVDIVSVLQSKYDVLTYGIYTDFSLGTKIYQDVEDALKDLEIGILVNNVCMQYDHPQYFALVPHQRMWKIMNLNVTAVTVMTHMLLPQMLDRGRGAIINVCSMSACTPPIPLTAEYSASMAYVDSFSQALHYENRNRGIFVQTLLPGFVTLQPTRYPTLFAPSAETYVRHAIATLGVRNRLCGYWLHGLHSWLITWIPEWLWVLLTRYINTASRRTCLAEREAAKAPLFSRKVLHHVPSVPSLGGTPQNHGVRESGGGKRHNSLGNRPNVSLRRTPSPQSGHKGRVHADSGSESPRVTHRAPSPTKGLTGRRHADSAPTQTSPVMSRRGVNSASSMAPAARRISLEEISRSRSSSTGSHGGSGGYGGGGIPPPIREDSLTFSAPSSPSDIRGADSPKFNRATSSSGANGGGNGRSATPPPRRSSTVSSVESPTRRLSACKRTSRVLVMPSVALYSYSLEPSAAGHSDVP